MARDDIGSIVAEAEREFPGLRVTNADRAVGQNAAAGGARDSQHLHGRARDLDISGVPEDRRPALLQYFRQHGVTGMGMYSPTGTSLHVDVRPGAFTAWGPDRRSTSLTQTPSYFQEAVRGTPVLAQATAVGDGSGANPAAGGSGSSTTTRPPAAGSYSSAMRAIGAMPEPLRGLAEQGITNRQRLDELARRQGETEQGVRTAQARGEADAQRTFAQAQRTAAEQNALRPIPAFIPTQETAADMGTLFSLLAVAGQALGGKGKAGAMSAMASMTGMLNGYRQGRQDLYQKERQNFEAGLRQIQAQNQALQEAYRRAQDTARTDMQSAMSQLQIELTRLGAPLVAIAAEKAGLEGGSQQVQQIMQVTGQLMARTDAQKAREAQERRHNETVMMQRQQGQGDAAVSWSEALRRPDERVGPFIQERQARAINATSSAMGEAFGIADEVSRHPTLFGRQGQVAAAYQRWVTSLGSGTPNATLTDRERAGLNESEQSALVAAKRYYAFLVGYENAIAGAGNRATVQLRQQFNALMNPNQFSQDGMLNLLRDHTRTMAQAAAQNAGSGRITYDLLRDSAIRDYSNTTYAQDKDSAARGARALGVMPGGTAPAPTATPQAPDLTQFLGAPR